MTDKTLYFVGGLPRSGSTLLMNILHQNPRYEVTSTSGLLSTILLVRNNFNRFPEHLATPNEAAKERSMRAILYQYHQTDRPVIFDKSRGWVGNLPLLEKLLGKPCRIICTVREVRDIAASFEKLHRNASGMTPMESDNADLLTTEGRCASWLKPDGIIGQPYNAIKDAILKGYRDRLHFVEYNALTRDPMATMRAIEEFLNEPYYAYDFNHVEQYTKEDDRFFGFDGLHQIRNRVEWKPSEADSILGGLQFATPAFWRGI